MEWASTTNGYSKTGAREHEMCGGCGIVTAFQPSFNVVRRTVPAAFLSVATQTSKELVTRDQFSAIGFGNSGLELGQLFGGKMNRVFTPACEDEDISSIFELRVGYDDRTVNYSTCGDFHG